MLLAHGGHGLAMNRAVRWLLEDRSTGKLVVWHAPNAPLWVWIAGAAVSRLVDGGVGDAASVVANLALAVWALLEIAKGVNPFRRIVGGLVLAALLVRLA